VDPKRISPGLASAATSNTSGGSPDKPAHCHLVDEYAGLLDFETTISSSPQRE
jgi:hypothetical protein